MKQLYLKVQARAVTLENVIKQRSLISPDYARNFICDFIIGKEQQLNQKALF